MNNTYLIITSIADHEHSVLKHFAAESIKKNISFIVIGDTKSPSNFSLEGCDFYSIERQKKLEFSLIQDLPYKHYARKNLGYLIAIAQGAKVIIETDDDNIPLESFWRPRSKEINAFLLQDKGWVNVYKYFTEAHIWPRGFDLEHFLAVVPSLKDQELLNCPIQQGLANENPDVDAIYRLTLPLPVVFNDAANIALGSNSICPFNSQNTTWFKEAFPLLYLPAYCSFRMTDIWRSFIAQRIAWTCDWQILFHRSTVWQSRNDHRLINDFRDEIPGYLNNSQIIKSLLALDLNKGVNNIPLNMRICYQELINLGFIDSKEMNLLNNWINDIKEYL